MWLQVIDGESSPELVRQSLASGRLGRRLLFGLFLLSLPVACRFAAKAQDTNLLELEKSQLTGNPFEAQRIHEQAREIQERYRLRVPVVQTDSRSPVGQPTAEQNNQPAVVTATEGFTGNAWLGALICVAGFFVLRRLVPQPPDSIDAGLKHCPGGTHSGTGLSTQDAAEERAFAEFLVAFKAGPQIAAAKLGGGPECPLPQPGQSGPSGLEPELLKGFLSNASERLKSARGYLQEMGRESEGDKQLKTLGSLCGEVGVLKGMTGLPEWLPAWQLASILESFLKQLIARPERIKPSTRRSIAAGLDVFGELCQSGLAADFSKKPLPRFLVVDDDSISRHAVSLALKKAFHSPEVAPNGEAALRLASEHSYDAVFLDVMMPGMDGFELCSKLHETPLNRDTPVVFVTCRDDFEARAKSSLCGGTDLMEKPFLTFEVALKALTLIYHARLKLRESSPAIPDSPSTSAVQTKDPHQEAPIAQTPTATAPSSDCLPSKG